MEGQMLTFKRNALLGNISGQPLCADFKSAWRRCGNDKEMLMRLALSQQSLPFLSHACYEHMGLTKQYIVNNFSEFINGRRTFDDVEGVQGYTYQMYVDFKDDFKAAADVTSLMWCSSPQVEIEACKCPVVYISNSSDVHIVCDGYNSLHVYLFDNSRVTIDDSDENSEVVVYKYSDDAQVELGKYCLGNVKVFDKELRL